jgi:hypothetical protein
MRRQLIGYVALVVALTGTAYAGSKNSSGKVGARDLRPVVVRDLEPLTIQPGQPTDAVARCRRGERALAPSAGGSLQGDDAALLQRISPIVANGKAKGFVISGFNPSSTPQTLDAGVLCLRP